MAALSTVGFSRAQEDPVFTAGIKLVNILVTVRNKKGALISDLNQDDFSISEDGRPQTVRYFARDTDLPLTLGLMVDTSASQRKVLDAERGATLRFLDQVVREKKDKVFSHAVRYQRDAAAGTDFFGRQTGRCAGVRRLGTK